MSVTMDNPNAIRITMGDHVLARARFRGSTNLGIS